MRVNLTQAFGAILSILMALSFPSCGGGDGSSGGTAPPGNKVVFVTSVNGSGDLGSWPGAGGNTGLAAGDAIWQARADAAGLTGTFKAWLSDSSTDAKGAYCPLAPGSGLTG